LKKPFIISAITFILCSFVAQDALAVWLSGYNYRKKVTVNATKVSGTGSHTNFPVMIKITDADLKTKANGGKVEHASGFDIVFTKDDSVTLIHHQVESYTATTGELIAYVNIASLSTTTNTDFYLYFGNSGVSSDASNDSTWNSSYAGVWHMHDDFLDATINNNDGSNSGSVDTVCNTADGQKFDGSNDRVNCGNGSSLDITSAITVEAWVYATRDNGWETFVQKSNDWNWTEGYGLYMNSSTWLAFYVEDYANSYIAYASGFNKNQWNHVVGTYDGSTVKVYLNGIVGGWTASFTGSMISNTGNLEIGRGKWDGSSCMQGKMDEVRISNVARTSDWIATTYNNLNAPGTFISAENTETNPLILPIELISFDVEYIDGKVELTWSTAAEFNNSHFMIERTNDNEYFEEIGLVAAVGNSNERNDYYFTDEYPLNGLSYYRLKQVDYDGVETHSKLVVIKIEDEINIGFTVFPNPVKASDGLNFKYNGPLNDDVTQIRIVDVYGKEVFNSSITNNQLTYRIQLPNDLTPGPYFFFTHNDNYTHHTRVMIQGN